MDFQYDFFSLNIICLSVTALCVAYIILRLVVKCKKVTRRTDSDEESLSAATNCSIPVSIIVYAPTYCHELRELIHTCFSQDYAGQFEVIVVNAEKDPDTEDLISELQLKYPNLYLTFSPSKPKNLSPKKLALTIGIKAAKFEYVVFTQGNATIRSNKWLSAMARHFVEGADMTIGLATINDNETPHLTAMQKFDFSMESLRWLSSALSGKVVRADGYNLAYKKSLFFRNKGFSRHLDIMFGDDDIFVSELSKKAKAAVELSAQSVVSIDAAAPRKFYRRLEMVRRFNAGFIQSASYFGMMSLSIAAWMAVAMGTLGIVFCQDRLYIPIAIGVLLISLLVVPIFSTRSYLSIVGIRKPFYVFLPLLLFWPFHRLKVAARVRRNKETFQAWGVFRPF